MRDLSKITFIHHGSDHFYPDRFEPVVNEVYPTGIKKGELAFDKPLGGFWATINRETEHDEWELFCMREMGHKEILNPSFKFTLDPSANIYIVETPEDVFKLSGKFRFDQNGLTSEETEFMNKIVFNFYKQYFIDFEQMVKDGYDGILVYMDAYLRHVLYAWDVTSLLIFNPSIIREKK